MNKIRTQQEKIFYKSFLDLSKAFDCINHKILLRRLENISFDDHATKIIENYSCESTQRGVLYGIELDWIILKSGIPPGTILGPLFLTFTTTI